MKTRLLNLWETIRTSFWLIPSLMVLGAMALSAIAISLDQAVEFDPDEAGTLLYMGGPEGASAILSTIAGSMITVAGVAFSIIIVALTLTSSQFGSRLLRNFVRDKGNQAVLGTFIATFTYCLLVLRSIFGPEGENFVPSVSVTFAMALALINVGVLIYFIHHVSTSIQVEHVTASVYRELWERMETYFPKAAEGEQKNGHDMENDAGEDRGDAEQCEIESERSGYVQAIDLEGLVQVAKEYDLVIEIPRRPGDFIVPGGPLATVHREKELDEAGRQRVSGAFILGLERTPEQDPEFAIHQLAEIAIRALSPGINDPYTAITCIDQLGSILCYLTRRAFPSPMRFDEDGTLRVKLKALTFEGVVGAAFDQVRQYGRSSVAVTIRLLEALENVARQCIDEEQRAAVRRQAEMIARASDEALPEENDRKDVRARHEGVIKALEGNGNKGEGGEAGGGEAGRTRQNLQDEQDLGRTTKLPSQR